MDAQMQDTKLMKFVALQSAEQTELKQGIKIDQLKPRLFELGGEVSVGRHFAIWDACVMSSR